MRFIRFTSFRTPAAPVGAGRRFTTWTPDRVRPFSREANASRAAAMVTSTSSVVCASERKAASNCDGARLTPRSSMARKNVPYRAASAVLAVA